MSSGGVTHGCWEGASLILGHCELGAERVSKEKGILLPLTSGKCWWRGRAASEWHC